MPLNYEMEDARALCWPLGTVKGLARYGDEIGPRRARVCKRARMSAHEWARRRTKKCSCENQSHPQGAVSLPSLIFVLLSELFICMHGSVLENLVVCP